MAPRIIWRKQLSSADVSHRLAFPTAILPLLPPFEEGANWVDVPVRVRSGDELEPHVFRCVIRRKGYKRPVLERGWKQLVRDKRLRQGDWLLVYVDDDDDGELEFKFQRSIKLFGVDIPDATVA